MPGRVILHVDMDAFYAAVEQLRRPELRGKPVIVGGDGDPTKRGVVSTASYEARKFGVHSAMPLRTAKKLCPGGVFLAVDFTAYREYSARMHQILRDTGAKVESLGLDEAFLDCTGLPDSGATIARAIKARIAGELRLTGSVGVGPNKLIAKVASGMNKPDGLTMIAENEIAEKLGPLPATVLWGIGPKTAARLKDALGIETIADLAAVAVERLQDVFGPRHGAYLHEIGRGVDDSPVTTEWEPKSISRERTFQVDLRHREAIRAATARIAAEVAEDLRRDGYTAANITLKIRLVPFHTLTRSRTIPAPVNDDSTVSEVALSLLDKVDLDRPVRLLGVRAGRLTVVADADEEPKLALAPSTDDPLSV
jgi:DNA polymerase IV